jgi:hypothetical protein
MRVQLLSFPISFLPYFKMISPLEQFEIVSLLPFRTETFDLSITNSSIYLFVAFGIIVSIFSSTLYRTLYLPGA